MPEGVGYQKVEFNGEIVEFPKDMPDEEIAEVLRGEDKESQERALGMLKKAQAEGFDVSVLDAAFSHGGWRDGKPLSERDIKFMRRFESSVSLIESDNNPKAVQFGGGPAEGTHQQERDVSESGIKGSNQAEVSMQRYRNFYEKVGMDIPDEYQKEIEAAKVGDSYAFAKLNPALQRDIFYAQHLMAGDFNTSELSKSDYENAEVMANIWMQHHKRAEDENLARNTQKLRERGGFK